MSEYGISKVHEPVVRKPHALKHTASEPKKENNNIQATELTQESNIRFILFFCLFEI